MSSSNSMLIKKLATYNGEHYVKSCKGLKNTGGPLSAKVGHLWQPYFVWGLPTATKIAVDGLGEPFTAGNNCCMTGHIYLYFISLWYVVIIQ